MQIKTIREDIRTVISILSASNVSVNTPACPSIIEMACKVANPIVAVSMVRHRSAVKPAISVQITDSTYQTFAIKQIALNIKDSVHALVNFARRHTPAETAYLHSLILAEHSHEIYKSIVNRSELQQQLPEYKKDVIRDMVHEAKEAARVMDAAMNAPLIKRLKLFIKKVIKSGQEPRQRSDSGDETVSIADSTDISDIDDWEDLLGEPRQPLTDAEIDRVVNENFATFCGSSMLMECLNPEQRH